MIPLFKVHIPADIGTTLQEVFDSGFITEGEYSDKFEKAIGEYIENPNVCLVNSCTSALHLAAHMMDLKEGDEIITTAMTCMATNEPFYHTGATLVLRTSIRQQGILIRRVLRRKSLIEQRVSSRCIGVVSLATWMKLCPLHESMI